MQIIDVPRCNTGTIMADTNDPVLHVIVVGFHHKKGCQVEYSYPPLIEGNSVESHEIPKEWKNIPSLSLPDGAHHYQKDTVYFLLPGRNGNLETVYGVSCYRQMDSKDLINKTADVTRSTVQKSVCVLSRLPLFGLIKAKLELITHAYFDERDFSQVALLEQTYNNLNSSLNQSLLEGTQVFLDLPVRQLVTTYKHKIIVLFKLMLLERKVLVFGSPVEVLCQTLVGIVSLFPGMLENGLGQACNQWNKIVSPTLTLANINENQDESDQFLEVRYSSNNNSVVVGESAHSLEISDSCDSITDGNEGDSESSKIYTSVAPESPTIPRDSFSYLKDGNNVKLKMQDCQRQNTVESSLFSSVCDNNSEFSSQLEDSPREKKDDPLNTCDKDCTQSGRILARRTSSTDSDKLSVHMHHRSKKESSVESETKSDGLASPDESPLAHISEITQIEAVQSGLVGLDIISNPMDNTFSHSPGSCLSIGGTKPLRETRESIDELDSPESLLEIDNEDCFSWEQDHLQLTLHEDIGENTSQAKESCVSVSSQQDAETHKSELASKNSFDIEESGRESVSSDSTSTSQSDVSIIKKKSKTGSPTGKKLKEKLSAAFNKKSKGKGDSGTSTDPVRGEVVLQQDDYGHPLAIFTSGSVFYPYLSLQYHDILTDVNTRCFAIGATNVLFKQRRQLIDVLIDVDEGKVEIRDKELQRQLSLTTADLRFAEYLVKTVTEDSEGSFMDGTEWEGSEDWIRAQFKHYINSLLSTVLQEDSKLLEDFGVAFLSAWKTTHNFRHWKSETHPLINNIPQGHPFQGNLSMSDVRNRFNHTFQNNERGKKINAAVVQTGKYVVQTGKVVGGAITSARSAVSTWFSSWRTPNRPQEQEAAHSGQGEMETKTEQQMKEEK